MTKRVAFAQLSSCWGCDQSLVDLHFSLLEVLPQLEILYWPAVVDFKLKDLEGLPDKSVHVGFVEGSCRTENDLHLLKVMREKSKLLVAWGSCSCFGGVQGLGNQWTLSQLTDTKFFKPETVVNPRLPTENVPAFLDKVAPNPQHVPFDIILPGCPPSSKNTFDAVTALLTGAPFDLPQKTVCDQCTRTREEKRIKKFRRTHEGKIDPKKCILDQGYLCLGFATIGFCGAQCPAANAPCKGCFGPPPGVKDHGAKIISALGGIVEMEPEELRAAFPDPIGSFYFVDYAASYLSRITSKEDSKK
ncbi:MAG: F420-nonreducing hydrogenase [Candidatus Thorarchaeota archaeon]|nr:F420-nonreducing hydrogenase [Candidatus Thorarchaeota archaeon]